MFVAWFDTLRIWPTKVTCSVGTCGEWIVGIWKGRGEVRMGFAPELFQHRQWKSRRLGEVGRHSELAVC